MRPGQLKFEEQAYAQRLLVRSERPSFSTGALDYVSVGCPTLAQFTRKDDQGRYIDLTLAAMWWAWQESRRWL